MLLFVLADCVLLLLLLPCCIVSYVRAGRYTNVQVLLIVLLLLYEEMPVGNNGTLKLAKKGNGKRTR